MTATERLSQLTVGQTYRLYEDGSIHRVLLHGIEDTQDFHEGGFRLDLEILECLSPGPYHALPVGERNNQVGAAWNAGPYAGWWLRTDNPEMDVLAP